MRVAQGRVISRLSGGDILYFTMRWKNLTTKWKGPPWSRSPCAWQLPAQSPDTGVDARVQTKAKWRSI